MKRPSLNQVYRLVWNERLNAWVAVAENVKARGKKASGALSLAVLMALGLAPATYAADNTALPTNGQIVAGQGSINTQGNTLTINQSSNRLIAQWGSFNIGKDSSVVFNQASSNSVALNRILDSNPSEIFGSLSANGQVYLVNPSGIVFGRGAQVNVGGLVASSLNISNEDFLAGNLKFSGSDASGAIINQGSISAAQGGVVAFLGPQVSNEGTITANGGSAVLAGGRGVSLDFVGDGLISYNIDEGTTRALVQNGGLVQADGGLAVLTAKAADAVNQAVVNNTGTVRAQTLASREGRILLLSDMEHGTTSTSGTLDASATGSGNGGFIETSAATVKIAESAVIDTRAANGETGNWLLDPIDYTIAATGGDITGAQVGTQLNTTNVTISTAGSGGNGDIFVNDAITTTAGYITAGRTLTLLAHRDINVNSAITSTSGSLNVVLNAARDVEFSSTGSVSTNGGSFTVGAPPATIPNYATPTGSNLTMNDGSFVSVGNGWLDIAVNGTISLSANSLRASGSTTRYLNNGSTNYAWNTYMRLAAGTAIVSTNNADPELADITGMTDVILQSGAIGDVSNPIKIRRTSLGNSLSVINSAGDSYVNVLNANATHGFNTVSVSIGNQLNSTQLLTLGGDLNDHGHILMNTDGSGVLNLLDNDIDTAGTRSNISISAGNITFENNSVDVGNRAFTASAATMLGDGTDGVAEVIGGSVSFSGTELGTLARRLEVAGGDLVGSANTLYAYNNGGDTYITSVDNSFTSVYLTNVKTVGTHSVLFDNDHIDYTTDGSTVVIPTISAIAGADVRARNRSVSFTANSGVISFATDSVNTGSGSLAAVINSGNPDGGSGAVISAANSKDGQAEITTGNASFTVYTSGTGAISDIEIAQGLGASNNSLNVATYGGDVDVTELDSHHFKSLSVTLYGAHVNGQTIDLDLNGADDVSFADGVSRLFLDDTKLALTDFDRNWSLSALQRNVQIDSVDLGSGSYSITSSGLYLNSDVMTDGGAISLSSQANNIHLLQSVRIDSNADDDTNSTSTGAAGSISVNGNISAANDGYALDVDASSTTQAGGSITYYSNLGNDAGSYLSSASFTTKGSTDTNDGNLYLYGTSFLVDGDFTAIGSTTLAASSDVIIDTEQGNDGNAGNITFGGRSLSTSQFAGYTFGASTAFMTGNAGNVDLDTLTHSTITAKSIDVQSNGGVGGANGNIYLPAVNTAGALYSGTTTNQGYGGANIFLHGNLTSNGGNITLAGTTQLTQSVLIKTATNNTPGNSGVVNTYGVSATAAGIDLTIDTTTNGNYIGGNAFVNLNNAGGYTIDDLSVDARSFGGGVNGAVVFQSDIATSGNQTYWGGQVNMNNRALTSPGTIAINALTGLPVSSSGAITANALALNGASALTFNSTANQVNTLAAQGTNLTFINSGALTIGSVAGLDGINSSGTVQISTLNGDLTLARNVSTTNTTANAIRLNAGSSAAAGTVAGGNILVNNGVSVTTGVGGRATLYSGSIDDSIGLTDLVGFGSGRFRYGSDEAFAAYTAPLGSGVYAIYREQPTISVSVDDITAVYGSAPTLTTTFVNGKNGDAGSNFTYSIGDGDSGTADGAQSTSGNYIVGTHSITATSSSGAAELGYNVTGETGGTLTVTAKELTISGFIAADRAYDGTTNANIDSSGASVSGLVGGDAVSQDYSGATGAFDDKNVGTGKHITINGITLSGADAANYAIAGGSGSGTGNIDARVLNVDFTGVGRVYDGTTGASVVSSDNRVGNDVLTIDQIASFGDKNVGTGKHIDVSNITLSGADAGNYVLGSSTSSATGDITVRTLNLGFTGTNRVYDGTTGVIVTSSDNRVAGDDLTIEQLAALTDKNAGTGKTVNISNITIGGADAGNYQLTSTSSTTTADVAARTLILGYTGDGKKFDGTPRAGVIVADNRVAGDSLSYNVNAHYPDFTVGDNREVLIDGVTLGGADAGNYVISNPTGSTTANIEPGPISNHILASITSPQASLNGTSASGASTLISAAIGAGSGSGSLVQSSAPVIIDNRVANFSQPFSMGLGGSLGSGFSGSGTSGFTSGGGGFSGGVGASGLSMSQSGATSTLAISGVPAKSAERNAALPVYHARNSVAQFSSAIDVVDQGNSLSVTPTAGQTSLSVNVVDPTGPVATGSIAQPNGAAIELQVTVVSDSILLVTLPADAPAMDDNDVALLSLTLASKELNVTPKQLKGLVIRKR